MTIDGLMIGEWRLRLASEGLIADWRLPIVVGDCRFTPMFNPSVDNQFVNPTMSTVNRAIGNRAIVNPLIANRQSSIGNQSWVW